VAGRELLRVVVADDHEGVRGCLIEILESDFEVIGSASNGYDLVSVATRMLPDVIVSDVQMPLLGGIGAMRALQESGLDIPFVFVCADQVLAARVAKEFGACLYKIDASSELTNAVLSAAGPKQKCDLP
jgi:DNA-binding NarL/FixJ family response regulator